MTLQETTLSELDKVLSSAAIYLAENPSRDHQEADYVVVHLTDQHSPLPDGRGSDFWGSIDSLKAIALHYE